jgi:hypothetical protein
MRIGNAVEIMGEEIASAMHTDDVYTPSACSINEVEPQVSPSDIIMLKCSDVKSAVFHTLSCFAYVLNVTAVSYNRFAFRL